jgi:siderophore synthetase component
MLIAALTAYLLIHFGSHSSAMTQQLDQTAALIQKDVADEAHRKQALAIVDQMKAEGKAYGKELEKSVAALNGVLSRRAAPTSEIERAAQPLVADDRASAEKLLDLRLQLKSVLTPDEWKKVYPAQAADTTGEKKSA